jgi:hypothetical protein
MWGFESISMRPGNRNLPYARHGELALVADVGRADRMDLLTVPAAVFTGTGEPAAVRRPRLFASGRFAEPSPPEWREAAWGAQSLLAVIGPDDFPALDLSQVEGLDPADPEQIREGTQRLVSGSWFLKAAIAAVYLVMPARR